jgi:hypothetical protein
VADALVEMKWVGLLMRTTPFALVAYERERKLVEEIESEHFGVSFGLMLHYDAHLTVSKILSITQARLARLKPTVGAAARIPSPPLGVLRGGA